MLTKTRAFIREEKYKIARKEKWKKLPRGFYYYKNMANFEAGCFDTY